MQNKCVLVMPQWRDFFLSIYAYVNSYNICTKLGLFYLSCKYMSLIYIYIYILLSTLKKYENCPFGLTGSRVEYI